MHTIAKTIFLAAFALCAPAIAQDAPAAAPAPAGPKPTFDAAATDIQKQLEDSLRELSALRERVAAERLPLVRQLGDLEQEVV